jgi:hypothetical protein
VTASQTIPWACSKALPDRSCVTALPIPRARILKSRTMERPSTEALHVPRENSSRPTTGYFSRRKSIDTGASFVVSEHRFSDCNFEESDISNGKSQLIQNCLASIAEIPCGRSDTSTNSETWLDLSISRPDSPLERDDSSEHTLEHKVYSEADSHKTLVGSEVTANSSKRTSGVFSILSDSNIGCTDLLSRQQCSQPMTPLMSDFGEFVMDSFHMETSAFDEFSNDIMNGHSSFTGYKLTAAENSSVITLKPTPSPLLKDLQHGIAQYPKENLLTVERWNDGGESQTSSLQELMDDLGYLGSVIA